jgi:hypothetical protein
MSMGYEQDWLGEPMFWSSFEPEMTTELVKSSGLAVEWARIETADEDGVPVRFLWILARRRAPKGRPNPALHQTAAAMIESGRW